MPELPEVETARQLLLSHCLHSPILSIHTKESGGGPRDGLFDDIIIEMPEHVLQDTVKGRSIESVERRGKHLIIYLSKKGPHLLLHFGMTGSLQVKGVEAAKYRSFTVNKENQWPPRFCKFEIVFESGVRLAYIDPRRIGRCRIREKPLEESPIKELGLDPLTDREMQIDEFMDVLSRYSCAIKALLLNQEGPFCGLGKHR